MTSETVYSTQRRRDAEPARKEPPKIFSARPRRSPRLYVEWAAAILLLIFAARLSAADPELCSAAAKGNTSRVQALLKEGAPVDAPDKNGRTALMLAAQHGHSDTVKALLAAGANPGARDKEGFTAYSLAVFFPAGHSNHDAVLEALPRPARLRLAIVAGWSAANLVSSCFQPREKIIQQIGAMRPDESLLRELRDYIKTSGKGLAEIVNVDAVQVEPVKPPESPDADAAVTLEIHPGAACAAGNDNLTFSIDLRVFGARDRLLLLEKSLGGLKGLHAQTVSNPEQYTPVFQEWMKRQAGPIYWAITESLARVN